MIDNRTGLSHLLLFMAVVVLLSGCGRKGAPYWPENASVEINTPELYVARR
jgi:predicted small lipoprotein YifL